MVAMNRMERWTQYWPLTISSTIIYNMTSNVEALAKLIVRQELSDEQVIECQKVIYHLLSMESRNEQLPAAAISGHRDRAAKGTRREELYRILFKECEILLRHHCRSDQHRRILNCLLECRSKGAAGMTLSASCTATGKESSVDIGSTRAMLSDTPLSPMAKVPRLDVRTSVLGIPGKSLLEIWNAKVSAEIDEKKREFAGHIKARQGVVKLYAHLEKEQEG